MTKALDPMFAPVPYGDDRQVTRTRRGVHCIEEMKYSQNIVYCYCHSCKYEWEVDKTQYDQGVGPPPNIVISDSIVGNIGTGGTGDFRQISPYVYGVYNSNAHECCTGGVGLCGGSGEVVKLADFYPATGWTGADGSLTGGTGIYGDWTGETGENGEPIGPFGDATSLYRICAGSSGDSSLPIERMYGGYPLVCPNCCRVNFEAKYILPMDNPGKQRPDLYQKVSDIIPGIGEIELPLLKSNPICNATIVIDFQRIKSDFALGSV